MQRTLAAALLTLALATDPVLGQEVGATLVHLLDYIAVDYPEAVAGGKVRNEDEYREMTEFAGNVRQGIARLPERAEKAHLARRAERLAGRIAERAPEGRSI